MNKVVKVTVSPFITEVGTIARVVRLGDGSGEYQSYSKSTGWQQGGTSVLSMITAEEATPEMLDKRGLNPEQIEEVLFDPGQGE